MCPCKLPIPSCWLAWGHIWVEIYLNYWTLYLRGYQGTQTNNPIRRSSCLLIHGINIFIFVIYSIPWIIPHRSLPFQMCFYVKLGLDFYTYIGGKMWLSSYTQYLNFPSDPWHFQPCIDISIYSHFHLRNHYLGHLWVIIIHAHMWHELLMVGSG